MDIRQATRDYDLWLGRHLTLVRADLACKHAKMASDKSPFPFFRGTFYRWAQLLPGLQPAVMDAPAALCIGDLHVANFGTWRDAEGRLACGVNDFDEAFDLPYTSDLLRLAASAVMVAWDRGPGLRPVCEAVLDGYSRGIRARLDGTAEPTVVAERNGWLTTVIRWRDPERFWRDLCDLAPARRIPPGAAAAIRSVMPEPVRPVRVAARRAGMGSLGRQRFCAVARWRGGLVAREAKAIAPSACVWAGHKGSPAPRVEQALGAGIRPGDPYLRVRSGWIARRLAPDCDKLDLGAISQADPSDLLRLMGSEAALALGAPAPRLKAIAHDLKARDRWLREATKAVVKAVIKDWEAWRSDPLP